jgi:hypothetical protein
MTGLVGSLEKGASQYSLENFNSPIQETEREKEGRKEGEGGREGGKKRKQKERNFKSKMINSCQCKGDQDIRIIKDI